MQLKPGQRVYSHADFDFATVIEKHPTEPDWYRIRLDNPDIDGRTVTVAWEDDLEPVEEKHSA